MNEPTNRRAFAHRHRSVIASSAIPASACVETQCIDSYRSHADAAAAAAAPHISVPAILISIPAILCLSPARFGGNDRNLSQKIKIDSLKWR
jgi:hypothetical protein